MIGAKLKGLFTGVSMMPLDAFEWKPEVGVKFALMNLKTGEFLGRFAGEACFAFHHINAFEGEDEAGNALVHVDLMCYPKPFYEALTLEDLRSG